MGIEQFYAFRGIFLTTCCQKMKFSGCLVTIEYFNLRLGEEFFPFKNGRAKPTARRGCSAYASESDIHSLGDDDDHDRR